MSPGSVVDVADYAVLQAGRVFGECRGIEYPAAEGNDHQRIPPETCRAGVNAVDQALEVDALLRICEGPDYYRGVGVGGRIAERNV